jgi:hypothetical protein
MTVTLGVQAAVTDPFMESYVMDNDIVQSSQRALDGTSRRQVVARKRHWHVEWHGVGATMQSTILGELIKTTNIAWTPTEGTAYTTQCNSYKVQYVRGTARANISCDLVEV